MPHVSRKKLSPKILDQLIDSLLFVLTDIKDKKEMGEFLNSFLSQTEKVMLAKRLAIVFLLEEKIEETKIADTLNVTQPTVSRMRLWHEAHGAGYQWAITKIRKQKLLEEIKKIALQLAAYAIRAAGGRP